VVLDEAHPRCNMATDIAALVCEKGFHSLKGPIKQVTAPHTPVPFAGVLEDQYMPDAARIAAAVRRVAGYAQ
jgi:pyruvate dehydrogenase E1 component beta subunit